MAKKKKAEQQKADDAMTQERESMEAQAAEVEEALEEGLQDLQALATEYYEALTESAVLLTEQATEVYETSRTYVRSHPGSSFVGAFALGVVVGVLTERL